MTSLYYNLGVSPLNLQYPSWFGWIKCPGAERGWASSSRGRQSVGCREVPETREQWFFVYGRAEGRKGPGKCYLSTPTRSISVFSCVLGMRVERPWEGEGLGFLLLGRETHPSCVKFRKWLFIHINDVCVHLRRNIVLTFICIWDVWGSPGWYINTYPNEVVKENYSHRPFSLS